MSSSSSSGGGRRSRQQQKRQPAGWWPSWLPPYNSGGGDTPEPEAESGPKPPPGIDIAGYTLTPGYGPPPAPPISLPTPPPGIPVPGYRPPNEYGESIGEQTPDSDSGGQGSTGTSATEIGPPATTRPPAILVPPELLDISEDAFGSLEQHIAALNSGQPVESFTENIGQAPTPVTDEFGNRPLTPGQAMDVDYLLSFVTDTLAREALISLKREGIPPRSQRNDFMSPHAEWNWDATSDALALEMIDIVEQSEMDEQLAHADPPELVLLQEERESYIPLTPGQAYVVDNMLTKKIDGLAREVLITIKRDGLPPERQWNEFTAQLELLHGDETSDAQVLDMLALITSSDWNQLVAHEASPESVLLQEEPSEAQEPQPIGEQFEKYVLQSIVADSVAVPVAISHAPYDASGVGLISTDYNRITDEYIPFQVQSPVVGPDVVVEFVVPAESNDTTLGNYVVISFPASVYLEDEIIMRSLSNDPNHDPSQWGEGGRIFIAYGHLSEINHEHIYPGKIIDTEEEAIIGKTGNTGLQNPKPLIEHFNQHLDLAIVYYGSNMPGEMAAALQTYRTDRDNPHYFFGYAERSTLSQHLNNDNRLYGENIDPDRIPGLF